MGKLRIKIHPLFIIFGIYFAFTGKVFSFLTYTLCACVHELGHSLAAEKFGYRLKNVTLMPYGALVSGDMAGMSEGEECFVVIAGPLTNFVVGAFILALWWAFPETYPYTQLAAEANFALAAVNLLPAFPLDGGRLLVCVLSKKFGRVAAVKAAKILSFVFSGALAALFVYSCFKCVNFSILFFGAFIFLGATDKNSADAYVRIFDRISMDKIKKYKEIREIAVNSSLTVKKMYRILSGENLYRVYVFSERGELIRKIEPDELFDYLSMKNPRDKIA